MSQRQYLLTPYIGPPLHSRASSDSRPMQREGVVAFDTEGLEDIEIAEEHYSHNTERG